jgi:DNA-binding response OmpR family regulator
VAASPPINRPARILVVDDEPMVREVVARYLERDGFRVESAADGAEALDLLSQRTLDLVLLDVMLPAVGGLDVLGQLRQRSDIPVILLTARSEEPDRVLGLELGADDYVVKPFSPRELVARVRTVLRRTIPRPAAERMDFGNLVVDPGQREVTVDGAPVELTAREFDLLAFLAATPKRVYTRAQLLEQVWDSSPEWQDPATVTVHIRRIRQKIEDQPDQPRHLVTVWGVGYKFQA